MDELKQPPPPDEAIAQASRTARRANVIAIAAAIATCASALFTYQQASEARRSNDALLATQARNVYIDAPVARHQGAYEYFIRNRNREPVVNVYYRYALAGKDSGVDTDVGLLPGCSSVKMSPSNGDHLRAEFEPTTLFFTDPSGDAWQRDAFSQPVRNEDARRAGGDPRRALGEITPIDGC